MNPICFAPQNNTTNPPNNTTNNTSNNTTNKTTTNSTTPFPPSSHEAQAASLRLDVTTDQRSNTRTQQGNSLRKIQASLTNFGDKTRLGSLVNELEESDDPRSTQHLARLTSQMGDQYTWSTTPSDVLTTLENNLIKIAALMRLLEPIIKYTNQSHPITCPKCNICCKTSEPSVNQAGNLDDIGGTDDIDPFGYHSIRCKAGGFFARTRYWHNPLRDVWLQVFRSAGFECSKEPTNMIHESNKRPDVSVALADSLQYLHLDVRTCDPLLKSNVKKCSQGAGYAANQGAITKNNAWLGFTGAQGDLFQGLCHEHPGRIGEGALAALDRAAAHFASSTTQRNTFRIFWLQRLHMANTRYMSSYQFSKALCARHHS
jgi:hypothetical protein